MKWIYLIFLFTALSGCVITGSSWIHSPSSSEGTPQKQLDVHRRSVKKPPADGWAFTFDKDSTIIIVTARTISEKNKFGGIMLPVVPLFWIPKIDHYKDLQNSLIVRITSISTKNIKLITETAVLISNQQEYQAEKQTDFTPKHDAFPILKGSHSQSKVICFPLKAMKPLSLSWKI